MKDITLEELLEAGCHFGHQVNRRNPKANDFIFEERANVHIINLEKTREGLLTAAEFVKKLASEDKYLVVIGTKRQARAIVEEEVNRARTEGGLGIFYVTSRWIGGVITNFPEVSKNFKRLAELNELIGSKKRDEYTKREILLFEREKAKLMQLYEGIAELDRVPDALFIVGTQHEPTAIHEAQTRHVAVVGIVDTNADPSVVDYPIPANDDAVGSIKVITNYITEAWIEGKKISKKKEKAETEEKSKKTSKE